MAKLGEIFDSIPSWVKLLVVGGLFLQMYAVMYWTKGVHKELSKKQKLY